MNDLRNGGYETHAENVAYGRGLRDAQTFAKQAIMALSMGSFMVGVIVGTLLS